VQQTQPKAFCSQRNWMEIGKPGMELALAVGPITPVYHVLSSIRFAFEQLDRFGDLEGRCYAAQGLQSAPRPFPAFITGAAKSPSCSRLHRAQKWTTRILKLFSSATAIILRSLFNIIGQSWPGLPPTSRFPGPQAACTRSVCPGKMEHPYSLHLCMARGIYSAVRASLCLAVNDPRADTDKRRPAARWRFAFEQRQVLAALCLPGPCYGMGCSGCPATEDESLVSAQAWRAAEFPSWHRCPPQRAPPKPLLEAL
jgi:hypothetical protein